LVGWLVGWLVDKGVNVNPTPSQEPLFPQHRHHFFVYLFMQKVEELINVVFRDLCALANLVTDSFNELVRESTETAIQYQKTKTQILNSVNQLKTIFSQHSNPELQREGESVHHSRTYKKDFNV
jgi:hypothetical protein